MVDMYIRRTEQSTIVYNDLKVRWCGNRNYKTGDHREV